MKIFTIFLSCVLCGSCFAEPIAFFYALDADIKAFAKGADKSGPSQRVGNRMIATYKVGEHTIYAMKMEVGAIETAVSVAALLAKVRCTKAISIGPVGGLANDCKIGDWGLVAKVLAYQRGTETGNGFSLAESATYEIQNSKDAWTPSLIGHHKMTVASGEIFCASDSFRDRLTSQTGANTIDMNLAGVLAACHVFNLPVTAWRVVSDRADDHASKDFARFIEQYDGVGGKWVAEWVRHLPPDPADPRTHKNLEKLLDGSVAQ